MRLLLSISSRFYIRASRLEYQNLTASILLRILLYPSWIIAFRISEDVTIYRLYFGLTGSFEPISFANLLAFMKGNASKNPLKS